MRYNFRNQRLFFAFPMIICGILFKCSLLQKYFGNHVVLGLPELLGH